MKQCYILLIIVHKYVQEKYIFLLTIHIIKIHLKFPKIKSYFIYSIVIIFYNIKHHHLYIFTIS